VPVRSANVFAQAAEGATVTVTHCKTGLELVAPEKRNTHLLSLADIIIIINIIIASIFIFRLNRHGNRKKHQRN
jgi:hypothetical protein